MSNKKIYYYTSMYVLNKWLENETIWATRSTSSNDLQDTIYATSLFNDINDITEGQYKSLLDKIKFLLSISSHISNRFYKDLLYDFQQNNFSQYTNIISSEPEKSEWFFYGSNYTLSKLDDLKNNFGSVHLPYLRNPNIQEWLFYNILKSFSISEFSERFYFTKATSCRYKRNEILPNLLQIPFLYFPFVICFTTEKDNRFFWDAYTHNKGVAFEFDQDELCEYFRKLSSNFKYPYELKPIIYDKEHQMHSIIKHIQHLEYDLLSGSIEEMCIEMAYYKHPYWINENEIRVVVPVNYFNNSIKIKENYNTKYSNNSTTQDYTELNIPFNLVHRIIIGPQAISSSKEFTSLTDILNAKEIDVKMSNGSGISNI